MLSHSLLQGLDVAQPQPFAKGIFSRKGTNPQVCARCEHSTMRLRGRKLRRALILSPSSSIGSAGSSDSPSDSFATQGSAPNSKHLLSELFFTIAGLDRGAAADQASRMRVDDLVAQIENIQTITKAENIFYDPSLFSGTWRLVYTSGFSSGSLGGERPGPAFGSPILLGQVYQTVDTMQMTLDNVVEARIPSVGPLAMVPTLTLPMVEISLNHRLEVSDKTASIVFEKSKLRFRGAPDVPLPEVDIPSLPDFLQPPSNTRSAKFDNVYMDERVRISQGDRGECRIYVRDM